MRPNLSIAIVGGGTAGWMTANLLAHRWTDRNVSVALVEAPELGIIGVGEGSTPSLKRFFEVLGIAEAEWMPRCHATYKASIRFKGWSPTSGIDAYSHPFLTQLDIHTEDSFLKNCRNRRFGFEVPTAPELFFLNGVLAAQDKAPIAPPNFPFKVEYGYHFDSALLGKFLRDHAVSQGVTHIPRRIVEVQQDDQGDIAALITDRGEQIEADLFVDCSGLAAMLMQRVLNVPYRSFKANLFNDAAVVMPTPAQSTIPVETISTAMSNGWRWSIPLTSRVGNGYVYSTDFISADDAETELRAALGLLDSPVEARRLAFSVGQLERHWDRNCVGVGLAQGFIEPLEATALHLVLNTVEMFMNSFEKGAFTDRYRNEFNAEITGRVERVRDYIVAHYKLNTRSDTEYWRANRDNMELSDPLLQILDKWFRRGDVAALLQEQRDLSHFSSASWHCLLAGYGAFPPIAREERDDVDFYRDHDVQTFLSGCAMNFADHVQTLEHLSSKHNVESR